MAGYAIAENAAPRITCSGIARTFHGANNEMLVMRAIPVRMLYAYKIFDRATYIQNRMVMPKNCCRLRPPAKRRADDSVAAIPIMLPSLAQVTGECGASFLPPGRNRRWPGRPRCAAADVTGCRRVL